MILARADLIDVLERAFRRLAAAGPKGEGSKQQTHRPSLTPRCLTAVREHVGVTGWTASAD